MDRDAYARIKDHPLREVLQSVVTDHRGLPTKSQLRGSIERALPEASQSVHDDVYEQAVQLAEQAQDRERRFRLRGEADVFGASVLGDLEDADRLVTPAEEPEVDAHQLAADADPQFDNESESEREQRHAADAERQRLRKLGVKVE